MERPDSNAKNRRDQCYHHEDLDQGEASVVLRLKLRTGNGVMSGLPALAREVG